MKRGCCRICGLESKREIGLLEDRVWISELLGRFTVERYRAEEDLNLELWRAVRNSIVAWPNSVKNDLCKKDFDLTDWIWKNGKNENDCNFRYNSLLHGPDLPPAQRKKTEINIFSFLSHEGKPSSAIDNLARGIARRTDCRWYSSREQKPSSQLSRGENLVQLDKYQSGNKNFISTPQIQIRFASKKISPSCRHQTLPNTEARKKNKKDFILYKCSPLFETIPPLSFKTSTYCFHNGYSGRRDKNERIHFLRSSCCFTWTEVKQPTTRMGSTVVKM